MKLLKCLIFSFLIFATCCFCFGETYYFDFVLDRHIGNEDNEFLVKFNYKLDGYKEEDFIIIPLVDSANYYLFTDDEDDWFLYPNLRPKIKMRLSNFTSSKTLVCFDIKNISNGVTYKTPCKYVWPKLDNISYFLKINENLLTRENDFIKPVFSEKTQESELIRDKFKKWFSNMIDGFVGVKMDK